MGIKIGDLVALQDTQLSGLDVLPIVETGNNETRKVTLGQLATGLVGLLPLSLLTVTQLGALTPTQIAAIPTDSRYKLLNSPETTTAIAALGSAQIAALTTTALGGLSNDQIQAIPGLTAPVNQCTVLLHFDGTDTSTSITDSVAGKTWTANGNAQIDTSQFKFSGSSLLLDGTGDYVETADHADFAFGAGDFTIDAWVRFASVSGTRALVSQRGNTNASKGFSIVFVGSSQLIFETYTTGYIGVEANGLSFSTGQWYHIAVTRTPTNVYIFVDGVDKTSVNGTALGATAINNSTNPVRVGFYGTEGLGFNGWVDEFRVVTGTAVWTSDFSTSLPSSPYTSNSVPAELGYLKASCMVIGTPTGGNRGAGTINANAVYDDGVILSICYAIELANQGFIEDHHWSKPLGVLPGTDEVLDHDTGEVLVPAGQPVIIPGVNPGLTKFKARIGTEYDPMEIDTFIWHMRQKGHLTAFPNRTKITDENRPSVGGWIGRVVEMMDVMAVLFMKTHWRLRMIETGATEPYPTDGRKYDWVDGKWVVVAFHPSPDPTWVLNEDRGMYEPPPTPTPEEGPSVPVIDLVQEVP